MSNHDERRCTVLLTLQQALLGEVSPNVRVVMVSYTASSVHFAAYFDGQISDDERESMSMVETELLAALSPSEEITHDLIRSDAPEPIRKDCIWVYFRKEPLL